MCLAVPGKIVAVLPTETPFASALVEFDGIRREVSVACVPEARPGEYVMVHAGIAISRVDAEESARVLDTLRALGLEDGESADADERALGGKPR